MLIILLFYNARMLSNSKWVLVPSKNSTYAYFMYCSSTKLKVKDFVWYLKIYLVFFKKILAKIGEKCRKQIPCWCTIHTNTYVVKIVLITRLINNTIYFERTEANILRLIGLLPNKVRKWSVVWLPFDVTQR